VAPASCFHSFFLGLGEPPGGGPALVDLDCLGIASLAACSAGLAHDADLQTDWRAGPVRGQHPRARGDPTPLHRGRDWSTYEDAHGAAQLDYPGRAAAPGPRGRSTGPAGERRRGSQPGDAPGEDASSAPPRPAATRRLAR